MGQFGSVTNDLGYDVENLAAKIRDRAPEVAFWALTKIAALELTTGTISRSTHLLELSEKILENYPRAAFKVETKMAFLSSKLTMQDLNNEAGAIDTLKRISELSSTILADAFKATEIAKSTKNMALVADTSTIAREPLNFATNVARNVLFQKICSGCPSDKFKYAHTILKDATASSDEFRHLFPLLFVSADMAGLGNEAPSIFNNLKNKLNQEGNGVDTTLNEILKSTNNNTRDTVVLKSLWLTSDISSSSPGAYKNFLSCVFDKNYQIKRNSCKTWLSDEVSISDQFGLENNTYNRILDRAYTLRRFGYNLAERAMLDIMFELLKKSNNNLSDDKINSNDVSNAWLLVPAHARLAHLSMETDRIGGARHLARAIYLIVEKLKREWAVGPEQAVQALRQFRVYARFVGQLASATHHNNGKGPQTESDAETTFAALQLATYGDTALSSLASIGRIIKSDPRIDAKLKERNVLRSKRDALRALMDLGAPFDQKSEMQLEERINKSMAEIETYLSTNLPAPEDLADPTPFNLARMRERMAQGDALLLLHAGTTHIYGILAQRDGPAKLWISAIKQEELARRIASVRAGVDVSAGTLPRFPVNEAADLLDKILGPNKHTIFGLKRVFLVADGPLTSLPLGILPLEKVATEPLTPDEYRSQNIRWFATGPAVTLIPSVKSLALKGNAKLNSQGANQLLAFGNPKLAGSPGASRSVNASAIFTNRYLADPAAVRQLPALPDTEQEIKGIASAMGAKASDIFLFDRATEKNVKASNLKDYKIIAFATHGLMAGDLDGLSEPGLIMTPPSQASDEDDGVLTASEVSRLKLDADLILLSACNTAAPDGKSGAEGLSGLGRSFLTAGARSLIVTHWAIPSGPTVSITTKMFNEYRRDTSAGWAVALRSAVMSAINDNGPPEYAHPANWGAFVVFGANAR